LPVLVKSGMAVMISRPRFVKTSDVRIATLLTEAGGKHRMFERH
jgi:hypothetical protein